MHEGYVLQRFALLIAVRLVASMVHRLLHNRSPAHECLTGLLFQLPPCFTAFRSGWDPSTDSRARSRLGMHAWGGANIIANDEFRRIEGPLMTVGESDRPAVCKPHCLGAYGDTPMLQRFCSLRHQVSGSLMR